MVVVAVGVAVAVVVGVGVAVGVVVGVVVVVAVGVGVAVAVVAGVVVAVGVGVAVAVVAGVVVAVAVVAGVVNRFLVGDVVVLNGHRLPVTEVHADSLTVALATDEQRVGYFPQDWLPDPEPREEPEPDYPPGSVWQDANGQVYRRTAHTPKPIWQGFGSGLQFFPDDYPARPLTRLVPEPAVPDDARDPWDTFGTKRGVVIAETAGTTQYMPDPYVCQRPVPDDGLADNGARCGKRNPCPDHAGTYDDSEGDLEALARAVPTLTPGQPVAHRFDSLVDYLRHLVDDHGIAETRNLWASGRDLLDSLHAGAHAPTFEDGLSAGWAQAVEALTGDVGPSQVQMWAAVAVAREAGQPGIVTSDYHRYAKAALAAAARALTERGPGT